ncbi:MAG: hypothetical protein IH586_07265 [Anaerolineaceae bacterium]|nr:hypothetical protein [Anaerolineaceae bacterium]
MCTFEFICDLLYFEQSGVTIEFVTLIDGNVNACRMRGKCFKTRRCLR